VAGHGLDEPRPRRVVPEAGAQGADALGQGLVGDRDAAPDLGVEAVLGDQPAVLADQQGEGVEVAAVQLDGAVVAAQPAVGGIEGEAVEAKAAGLHFSAVPHGSLMPLTTRPARVGASPRNGGRAMATSAEGDGRRWRWWRAAPWAAAGLLLLAPVVAMRFADEVDWDATDFAVIGVLLAAVCGTFELAARRTENLAYRAATGIAAATALLLIWINLAVGIIGEENAPANLLYLGVVAVAIAGAAAARGRAAGMVLALLATAAAQAGLAATIVVCGWGWRPAVLTLAFAVGWLASAGLFRRAARAPGRR